jgi:hypothetical protein
MINLKILSTAAAVALVLPTLASTSFAQSSNRARAGVAAPGVGGGAPAARMGGGAAAGGFRAAAPQLGGGGVAASNRFRAAAPQLGGGAAAAATPQLGGGAGVTRYSGGGGWRGGYGGGYRGGYGGYRYYRGGGGFIPGAVAGAVIGGAIASQNYGYYGGPGYYAPSYYDDQYADGGYGYYDDGAVAAAAAPVGDDSVAYCTQKFKSYDPASGTYLGYDGLRHPCP